MSRRLSILALPLAALLATAPDAHGDPATPLAVSVPRPEAAATVRASARKLELSLRHGGVEGVTRCELCHSTASWSDAKFDHSRTGFPLEGAHEQTDCRSCHARDFKEPLARSCAGCHRDAHRGELGQRCEGCHDAESWKARFDADAHRRTNFPLVGRHAVLPCTECHTESRDLRFARTTVECIACHDREYQRTALGGSVNHPAQGFSTNCRECHAAFRWQGALFPGHDACFPITSGPHANVACADCHTTIPRSSPGTCRTNTAACSSCHEHLCARSDEQHRDVPGYECRDRKCYECHQSGGGR